VSGEFLDWSTLSAWDVTFALLSVVAGWIASRLVRRGILALMGRLEGISAETGRRIAGISGIVVLLLGVGVALSFLGAPLQPVLAIVIIVAIVALLVLRGIADNFSAGIVLQTRKPVQPGDQVATPDYDGTVEELTSRSVVVRSFDGRAVHIPNAEFLNSPFVNGSAFGANRTELEVRTPLGGLGVEAVLAGLEEVAASVEGVLASPVAPTPWARAITIGDDRVTARLQVWHQPGRSQSIAGAVVVALAAALADRGPDVLVTSELPTSMTRTEER
jgi:small-conductance mechanosensitive channel